MRFPTAAEAPVVLLSAVGLPLTAAMIGLLGLRRTNELVERIAPLRTAFPDAKSVERASQVQRVIASVGRRSPIKFGCLPQSLLLKFVLRRQGLDPQLRIGVARTGPDFEAHAWVELGETSLESEAGAYNAFDLPSSRRNA